MLYRVTDQLRPSKPLIPLDLEAVRYLVIHHVAAKIYTWEMCNVDHKSNGWSCAGYNAMVYKNGDCYILRGDNIGAQTAGYNSKSYGIAVEGDYDTEKQMPEAQYKTLVERVRFHLKRFPNKVLVIPHNQLGNTQCPGIHFPMVKLLDDAYAPEGDEDLTNALNILRAKKIVLTPEYWLANAREDKLCKGEYVRQLILNFARAL